MSTRLENEFTVPVPVDRAWATLLDVERVAPCMPGATLDSVEGDTLTGRVKVKVGPVTVTYRGQATFVEKDETRHTVLVEAKGKEARGTGEAQATVRATLHDADGDTRVEVNTDLNVTGRVAQFGRGVMADVSAKLVDRFATNLAAELRKGEEETGAAAEPDGDAATSEGMPEAGTPETSAEETPPATDGGDAGTKPEPTPERQAAQATEPPASDAARAKEDEAIDLIDVAGGPVVRRVVAAVGTAIVGFVLLRWLRRRSRRAK